MGKKNDTEDRGFARRLLKGKRQSISLTEKLTGSIARSQARLGSKTISPIVTGISPNIGSVTGGLIVTISGAGFTKNTMVTIGGIPATKITVINTTILTLCVPAYVQGPLVKDVEVTHVAGTITLPAAFTYLRTAAPNSKAKGSYLVDDTPSMARARRIDEQSGHRQLARVNARTHSEEMTHQSAPEGELQNSILQHPLLSGQRFDGIDPNLNPEPPLNTDARREFDNERREQEMEKQLRLGNTPKFTSPKPSPS